MASIILMSIVIRVVSRNSQVLTLFARIQPADVETLLEKCVNYLDTWCNELYIESEHIKNMEALKKKVESEIKVKTDESETGNERDKSNIDCKDEEYHNKDNVDDKHGESDNKDENIEFDIQTEKPKWYENHSAQKKSKNRKSVRNAKGKKDKDQLKKSDKKLNGDSDKLTNKKGQSAGLDKSKS